MTQYIAWTVLAVATLAVLFMLCQVFALTSVKIPTSSMHPVLQPGDMVLVEKLTYGARLFSLDDAFAHKPLQIKRTPHWGWPRRNDVIVFNFPYPERWDSVGFNVMLYYCKRCIGLPGDTLEIVNGRYYVRGCSEPLGAIPSQDTLRRCLSDSVAVARLKQAHCYDAYPLDSAVGWTVGNFGPLYVPKRGDQVRLDSMTITLYGRLIEWETRTTIDSISQSSYTFAHDYYFAAGDNVLDSQDSRYWGLLPDDYIVGRAVVIWNSTDPLTGKKNWSRIFKSVY